jgi:hypothetical protein
MTSNFVHFQEKRAMRTITGGRKEHDNASYQDQLVTSLLNAMSTDDAIEFCLDQGWDQTLQAILFYRRRRTNRGITPERTR